MLITTLSTIDTASHRVYICAELIEYEFPNFDGHLDTGK